MWWSGACGYQREAVSPGYTQRPVPEARVQAAGHLAALEEGSVREAVGPQGAVSVPAWGAQSEPWLLQKLVGVGPLPFKRLTPVGLQAPALPQPSEAASALAFLTEAGPLSVQQKIMSAPRAKANDQ